MSEQDKAARRAVRSYLEALEDNKPRRGRKRTPETIQKRIDRIAAELSEVSALKKLQLNQERIDLQAELEHISDPVDLSALEAEFIEHAKTYGASKGVSYQAWRESGVDAAVLKNAGISRAN